MFYSIIQCGRSIHFLRDFVAGKWQNQMRHRKPSQKVSKGTQTARQEGSRGKITKSVICKILLTYYNTNVMSEMDFILLVAAGVLVLMIYYWIVSGLIDTCAFACRILNRVITWPFRALGRLISP